MRATCPSCEAIYQVPDHLVGAGRRLRCARCGHEWVVRPPTIAPTVASAALGPEPPTVPPLPEPPPAAATPPSVPAPSPTPGLKREPQVFEPARATHRPPEAQRWVAWGASALAMVLILVAAWQFRGSLQQAWPPLAHLYAWLGA